MTNFRLKVLKDEIKKPYFIALKKFLWEEGVRGPDEIPRSLKVYPSRECTSHLCVASVQDHCIPADNIYAWSNTPLGKVKVVIIGQDPCRHPRLFFMCRRLIELLFQITVLVRLTVRTEMPLF
jgi:uracil-DNA glycosylase